MTSNRPNEAIGGGVLSDGAIKKEVDEGRLIVDGFEPDSLRPASYDLTVATDGLIDPAENKIEPDQNRRRRRVSLQPGDAAMFSTQERFCMPATIAGNITIKNRLATEGLMLLSGGLIDPSFGYDKELDELPVPIRQPGSRLYLHVANIGKDMIEIRPGTEQIARVQFLRVCGEALEREPIGSPRWDDQKKLSLGFLSEMKELKERVEHTSFRSEQVVLLGLVVLGISLIGVSLSTILSITMNTKLMREVHNNLPHTATGKILLGASSLGVALAFLALAIVLTRPIVITWPFQWPWMARLRARFSKPRR